MENNLFAYNSQLPVSGPSWSQQPPAITGISHVKLYADDIATSRKFYVEILGWQPVPATGTQPGLRKSISGST